MKNKVKKILKIISIIILVVGIVLGILVMFEKLNVAKVEDLYVDGTNFSGIANIFVDFMASAFPVMMGIFIIFMSIIIDTIIWIVYGILILIINLINKVKN